MANELKTASVLAFERKLDPSDALMSSGNWSARTESQNWTPITLHPNRLQQGR